MGQEQATAIEQGERTGASVLWPAAFLCAIVVLGVPVFLCLPPNPEMVVYDVQAMVLGKGGVLYRDVFEPNLPGAIWIHAIVRSLFGTGIVALRAVDLAVFTGIVWLLADWLKLCGMPVAGRLWTSGFLFMFYLTAFEGCHCQRDMWLLLPSLIAVRLRAAQIDRIRSNGGKLDVYCFGVAEGLILGCAFWIKPHVAVPGLAVWLVSARLRGRLSRVCADAAGLLTGGLVAGALGIWWLHSNGAWPHFLEVLLEWNPQYVSAGRERWSWFQIAILVRRLAPWPVLYLGAIPAGLWLIARCRGTEPGSDQAMHKGLIAAMFVGWCLQGFGVQHAFAYVHGPIIVLIAIAASGQKAQSIRKVAVAGFLILFAMKGPLDGGYLTKWKDCLREGSTPQIQDLLAFFQPSGWADADKVAAWLKDQAVQDGDVFCIGHGDIYLSLNTTPSSRYVEYRVLRELFPSRAQNIENAVRSAGQKYVVADCQFEMPPTQLRGAWIESDELHLPPSFPDELRSEFPWSQPIVYRSGTLFVFRSENASPE